MDAIEQRHRVLGLVGLKLADQMQRKVAMLLAQRGPLRLGFLHAVFAEYALARLDQRQDRVGAVRLADGDQRDVVRPPLRDLRGLGDAGLDFGQWALRGNGWIVHGALL